MKIVVCVKQVIDVTFPFALNPEALCPEEEDIFYRTNPADAGAAEIAVRMQEKFGAEVSFLTFGPPRVEKVLKDCLAMGGDRAIRVWDDQFDIDSPAKAYILAQAVGPLAPDLVLCGSRSLDEGSGQTPPALAECLGFAQVTGVTDFEFGSEQNKVVVKRALERGRREVIECCLPAVLAFEVGVQPPRYASLPRLLDAHRAQVSVLNADALGSDAAEVQRLAGLGRPVRRSLPRPRPKKTFAMESGLSAEQRMELMMSGGSRQAKSDVLEGTPQDLAVQVAAILREKIPRVV